VKTVLVRISRLIPSHFEENCESLALGYLASALRAKGHDVSIVDSALTGVGIPETVNKIISENPQIIGFTIPDSTYMPATRDAILILHRYLPYAHTTVGGHLPSFRPEETLQYCTGLDSVVRFEGEQTLCELVEGLEKGKAWQRIKGISFKDEDSIIHNPLQPLIRDIDSLPSPSRDTLQSLLRDMPEIGVVVLTGSRGCFANCGFCSVRAFYSTPEGPLWRKRSPEAIVEEIEELVRNFSIKEVAFVDDVFAGPGNGGLKRMEAIGSEFRRRGLRIALSISERADCIAPEIVDLMWEIGVRQCVIGVEAGDDDQLRFYQKGTTTNQSVRAVQLLQDAGIEVTASFINFSPATSARQLKRNIEFLLKLDVNFLQGILNRLQPYPGTPIGEQLLKQGKIQGGYPFYDYVSENQGSEIAYEICRKTLGPFLTTSYHLKRLRRAIRLNRFLLNGNETSKAVVNAEHVCRKVERKIMEEASEIFLRIIDFAEDNGSRKEIAAFQTEVSSEVQKRFKEWINMMEFIKIAYPVAAHWTQGSSF
jgi:radical SAM superfamily enzyme YgiQ (UPF0313 family)